MSVLEPRIYTCYKSVLCQDLIYMRQLKSVMQLPRIMQCVLNWSDGRNLKDKMRGLPGHVALQLLSGIKNKSTRSQKSIAAFQLRKGSLLGCTVTLRGRKVYSFLEQCITAPPSTLPGEEKNLSINANYNFSCNNVHLFPGLEEHFIPLSSVGGFNCTLLGSVTCSAIELRMLLTALQFPLAKESSL